MNTTSLQKLEKALFDFEVGQRKHLLSLQHVVAKQQRQINSIERAIIGEPTNSYYDITEYSDERGI